MAYHVPRLPPLWRYGLQWAAHAGLRPAGVGGQTTMALGSGVKESMALCQAIPSATVIPVSTCTGYRLRGPPGAATAAIGNGLNHERRRGDRARRRASAEVSRSEEEER